MNRYDARESAFALVFSLDFSDDADIGELLTLYCESESVERDAFFESLVRAVADHKNDIDHAIEGKLAHWSLARLSKITLAVLRLGTAELLYFDETPNAVVINEAVEIAKKYEGKESGRFVNGILSAIAEQ